MGITGLPEMLKSVTRQVHISKYAGKTAGIDVADWLYRGAFSFAEGVVLDSDDTNGYLNFCLDQIKLLQEHDVTPIFVFDGAYLPAKDDVNSARNRARQKARDEIERAGALATKVMYNKALSVTNDMKMRLIAALRRLGIAFIVAPYEADAQLAFMSRHKLIDVVISKDSDCVPYGCRTMLFQWAPGGWANELKRRSLGANESYSFVGWTEEMFIVLCVLCGSDYCPSVPSVGIKSAYELVNKHKLPTNILRVLQETKSNVLPSNFVQRFFTAILTFRHHLVFDPRDKRMKMLNPIKLSAEILPFVDQDLHFLGNLELSDNVVALIASGDIHPVTLESYDWRRIAASLHAEQLQAYMAPRPSAVRSMTSTESSVPERLSDRHRPRNSESDAQSHRSTNVSELDATERERVDGSVDLHCAPATAHRPPRPREREDREQPRAASTSYNHLDSVLGASLHILNFRSPKVSDNFRPLVSLPSRAAALPSSDVSAREVQAFANQAVRQSVQRVKNPAKRRRADSGSGFDGEVLCRLDATQHEPATAVATTAHAAPHQVEAALRRGGDVDDIVAPTSPAETQSVVVSTQLKRPRPFAPRDATINSYTIDVYDNDDGIDASESERSWRPRPFTSAMSSSASLSDAPSSTMSYSRATLAEEKWDRILGDEIDERCSCQGYCRCEAVEGSENGTSSPIEDATPQSPDASSTSESTASDVRSQLL